MAQIKFKGNDIHTEGDLPKVGTEAPDFTVTKDDLQDVKLSDYRGKKVVLNIFPSIDTGVCQKSVRHFNEDAQNLSNAVVVGISRDLPFAHKRFCAAEGLGQVISTSEYKNDSFSSKYPVKMQDGPLQGLFSRAVIVLDEQGKVVYTEQVPEITQEPDYKSALDALHS